MSYIVDLDLRGKAVLIVGGGRLAEAHAEQLLAAGAAPRIVAPEITVGVARLIEQAGLAWEPREHGAADLATAWLVLALTEDTTANAAICREADRLGKLAYGDGDGFRGNVNLPAVLRRGSLVLAVGASMPHLARQILLDIEEDFGPDWADYIARLDAMREGLAGVPDELVRHRLIHRVTSPAVLGLVRGGDSAEWKGLLESAAAEALAAHQAADQQPERV